MNKILKRAEATLRKWRKKQAENATYKSASGTVDVSVTQAETRTETDNGEIIIDSTVTDWLIDADELDSEPRGGDVITYETRIYTVCALGDTCWTHHGRDGGTYRIHSRLTGTES